MWIYYYNWYYIVAFRNIKGFCILFRTCCWCRAIQCVICFTSNWDIAYSHLLSLCICSRFRTNRWCWWLLVVNNILKLNNITIYSYWINSYCFDSGCSILNLNGITIIFCTFFSWLRFILRIIYCWRRAFCKLQLNLIIISSCFNRWFRILNNIIRKILITFFVFIRLYQCIKCIAILFCSYIDASSCIDFWLFSS